MKSKKCVTCGAELSGKQRRFCSLPCKNADTNNRHQNYGRQQERGLDRKLQFLLEAGGCCGRCGYNRNFAALTWHHVEPAKKRFSLDIRAMSNRSEDELRSEIKKCVVLCTNCHAELHFPQMARERMGAPAKRRVRETR
jgi:RNase P subunit RPR2